LSMKVGAGHGDLCPNIEAPAARSDVKRQYEKEKNSMSIELTTHENWVDLDVH